MNGRLPIHFVGSEEKWSLFEELTLFKRRYLTPPAPKNSNLNSPFEYQISLSPWRVEMLIVDQCISSFGAISCCSWFGRLLDILSGDFLLVPHGRVFTCPILASWEQHQPYISYVPLGLIANYSFSRPNVIIPCFLTTIPKIKFQTEIWNCLSFWRFWYSRQWSLRVKGTWTIFPRCLFRYFWASGMGVPSLGTISAR